MNELYIFWRLELQTQTTDTDSRVTNFRVSFVATFFAVVLVLVLVVFGWASPRVQREVKKGMYQ